MIARLIARIRTWVATPDDTPLEVIRGVDGEPVAWIVEEKR
ncbi:MAG: hypothetical protein ACRDMV_10835 [Streptosporangiales bacterium]